MLLQGNEESAAASDPAPEVEEQPAEQAEAAAAEEGDAEAGAQQEDPAPAECVQQMVPTLISSVLMPFFEKAWATAV
jgi:hypothetical protein